jgi:hypothetical protein
MSRKDYRAPASLLREIEQKYNVRFTRPGIRANKIINTLVLEQQLSIGDRKGAWIGIEHVFYIVHNYYYKYAPHHPAFEHWRAVLNRMWREGCGYLNPRMVPYFPQIISLDEYTRQAHRALREIIKDARRRAA